MDTTTVPLQPGDRFLLCSDGLHGTSRDRELGELLVGEREEVAERLIDLANQRGGKDNITVVVADVEA